MKASDESKGEAAKFRSKSCGLKKTKDLQINIFSISKKEIIVGR